MNKKFIVLFVATLVTSISQGQELNKGDGYALYTPGAAMQAQTPPAFALRTNLLYWGLTVTPPTVTPNAGVEVGITNKMSVSLICAYNPWNLKGTVENNKKIVHVLVEPELRYWFCERFNGSAIGLHGIFASYNVGMYDVPSLVDQLFNKDIEFKNIFNKDNRYEGKAYGAGISYNYHWILGKHIGLEFSVGAGFAFMNYEKFPCAKCAESLGFKKRIYYGPTKLGINLIYVIK